MSRQCRVPLARYFSRTTAPPSLKGRVPRCPLSQRPMPATISHPLFSSDPMSTADIKSPKLEHHDLFPPPDSDQMIFGPLELDDRPQHDVYSWDAFHDLSPSTSTFLSPFPHFDFHPSHSSPVDPPFDDAYVPQVQCTSPVYDENAAYWVNDPEQPPMTPQSSSSSPIPIRASLSTSPPFFAYDEQPPFPQSASFSPSDFAARPRSISPPTITADPAIFQSDSISPPETSLHPPDWASKLWHQSPALQSNPPSRLSPRRTSRSDTSYANRPQRFPLRRDVPPIGQTFQSSSAPSLIQSVSSRVARTYSHRAESVSAADDRDATVRRKKRASALEESRTRERTPESRETRFPYYPTLSHSSCSSTQVSLEAAKISAFRMAVVLYGLDPTTTSL
jgi:hypothetical protein